MGLRSTHWSSTKCVKTNIISTARQWQSPLVGDRSHENAYYVQKDCRGTNESSSSTPQSSYVQCTSSKPGGLLSTLRLHALQIPDAPYSGILASLRLGLDSHLSLNRLSIAGPSRGQAGPMALLFAPIRRLRTGPEIITNRMCFPCSSAWVVYLRTYGAHACEQNSPATGLRCSWHLTCYFLHYHSSMTFGNLARCIRLSLNQFHTYLPEAPATRVTSGQDHSSRTYKWRHTRASPALRSTTGQLLMSASQYEKSSSALVSSSINRPWKRASIRPMNVISSVRRAAPVFAPQSLTARSPRGRPTPPSGRPARMPLP
jgi:hypothetical protein